MMTTEKRKKESAYQFNYLQKIYEETDTWLREMRDGAYFDYLDKKTCRCQKF